MAAGELQASSWEARGWVKKILFGALFVGIQRIIEDQLEIR
jgi:hypothetical protein